LEIALLEELSKDLNSIASEKVIIYSASGVEEKNVLKDLKLISLGAEAAIVRCTFLDIDAVIKWRFPKPYMPPDLDKQFRVSRTITEAKALFKAISIGVLTPIPLYMDPARGLLIMTFVDGYSLRDAIQRLDENAVCDVCRIAGMYIAKLHENSIVHGDVTTSNIVIEKGTGDVYLIDFGLSNFVKRIEDEAIDVHIFFRSVESAHQDVEDLAKRCFIDGYRSVRGAYTDNILKMVLNIRRMGRYVAERRLRGVWGIT